VSLNQKMAAHHEGWACEVMDATRSPASGSQWANPIDGRQNHLLQEFAFAFDCKSTLGQSIGVSRKMWEKARLQAGGERPMVPLRFYENERLEVALDLIVVDADDHLEMAERIRTLTARVAELEAR
jgi:hypothetical protein